MEGAEEMERCVIFAFFTPQEPCEDLGVNTGEVCESGSGWCQMGAGGCSISRLPLKGGRTGRVACVCVRVCVCKGRGSSVCCEVTKHPNALTDNPVAPPL